MNIIDFVLKEAKWIKARSEVQVLEDWNNFKRKHPVLRRWNGTNSDLRKKLKSMGKSDIQNTKNLLTERYKTLGFQPGYASSLSNLLKTVKIELTRRNKWIL